MKIGIILCGNIRTFFMPSRENNIKLINQFFEHIIKFNNADLFIFTDTNDFFHNNTQYFHKNIEIMNEDTSRLHHNINFINYENAKSLILSEFTIFDHYLKDYVIESPYDINQEYKLKILQNANLKGNNPVPLLHQVRKMKLCYDLLKNYEDKHNFKYDIILKWRFDNSINGNFNLLYDYINTDIYVPGIHSPVIYDWFAHGNRKSMDYYLSLYDVIGEFLHNGRMYLCSKCCYSGSDDSHKCSNNELYEITLSVEYHLFCIFNKYGLKIHNSNYQSCPYRYNNVSMPIDDFMKKNKINAKLISYKQSNEITEKIYK